VLTAAAALVLSASVALAQPATQPAAADAAVAYARAVDKLDHAAVRQMLVADDPALNKLADAYAELLLSSSRLRANMNKAFRQPGPTLNSGDPFSEARPKVETVGPDRAKVVLPGAREPLPLRLRDGRWVVWVADLVADPTGPANAVEKQAAFLRSLAAVMNETAGEIDDGRYANPQDAQAVLNQRVSEVLGRDLPDLQPSTQPASR
jgi:hypothetical protein